MHSESKKFRVGLIGAGFVGAKRAQVISEHPHSELVAVADVGIARAEKLAAQFGAENCCVTGDGMALARADDIDVIVVSTINKFLAPFAIAALQHGKHVLSEKPLGRSVKEAQAMVRAAHDARRVLKTGFNHRHFPHLHELFKQFQNGAIGEAMYVRIVYGHGGRPGYEREWRMNPELSGGGHLMDQGIHSVDLARWLLGDIARVFGDMPTLFYPTPQEDNVFALMWNENGCVAQFHAGLTQWKNRFEVELGGMNGTLRAEGRGGHYGASRLILYQRPPQGGKPIETIWEFDDGDPSWANEWAEFLDALRHEREPMANGVEGLRAMEIVEALYKSARTKEIVNVKRVD